MVNNRVKYIISLIILFFVNLVLLLLPIWWFFCLLNSECADKIKIKEASDFAQNTFTLGYMVLYIMWSYMGSLLMSTQGNVYLANYIFSYVSLTTLFIIIFDFQFLDKDYINISLVMIWAIIILMIKYYKNPSINWILKPFNNENLENFPGNLIWRKIGSYLDY